MEALKVIQPTPEDVRGMPLHEITARYGTIGLYTRLEDSLRTHELDQDPKVQWAFQMGLTLHANDTRTSGHYEDHILRVTLRIIDHYGITDPSVVAAALLHDSPEDHPKDLVLALTGEAVDDVREARQKGLDLIALNTDHETADIVSAVTNPLLEEGQNELVVYGDHTEELVLNHPKGRVVKLSDFTDNAVGNHYTLGDKRQKLDEKYLEQYRIHRMGLYLPDSLITGDTRMAVLKQLAQAHARSLARLAAESS
jgi:hypothetical protein